MMKISLFAMASLIALYSLQAQKLVKKSIVHSEISFFQIDANNCFKVDLQTSVSDELVVEAFIDGEYRKDLLIKISEEGSTLKVSAGFQPNFVNPNDKLSAHKVISIALKISLPELKRVQLFGSSSNISINGLYSDLNISLNDGRCILNEVSQNVFVQTQSGDITVNSLGATIEAKTRYGKIYRQEIPRGDSKFILNSTSGDIRINRTQG